MSVVDLQKLRNDQQLVSDCARYGEGLFSESDVRKRHRLPESVWAALGSDDLFVEKVEAEKLRRIRNGNLKRERAQTLIVESPAILGDIMRDPAASPRHRVDAIKTLDTMSATGPDATPPADQFHIVINLGADHILKFGGSRAPNNPNDDKLIEHNIDDDSEPRWR